MDAVDRVIAALNARDVESFVGCYAEEATIHLGDGTALARGHAELRARYGPLLAGDSPVHIEVLQRIEVGHWVVQEECVTGRAPEPERHVAVYRLADGLIAEERLLA